MKEESRSVSWPLILLCRNSKAHVHVDDSWRDRFRGERKKGLRGWVAIPPREGGWLERRMKHRMEGSLRSWISYIH